MLGTADPFDQNYDTILYVAVVIGDENGVEFAQYLILGSKHT